MSSSPSVNSLLNGARILVVEDEWMIATLLADLLQEFGCEVVGPATHLAAAIDLASAERIDCAILDLNVTGEPVYPVAKILSDRGIPFAFITGYKQSVISEVYRERPMLQKPFNDQKLSEMVRGMLSLSVK